MYFVFCNKWDLLEFYQTQVRSFTHSMMLWRLEGCDFGWECCQLLDDVLNTMVAAVINCRQLCQAFQITLTKEPIIPNQLDLPNQTYQSKSTQPNLPKPICQTKPNKLTVQIKLAKQNLPNQAYHTKPNLSNQIYQTKAFQIKPTKPQQAKLNVELWIELQSKITVPLAMFNQDENCLDVSFPKGAKVSHL